MEQKSFLARKIKQQKIKKKDEKKRKTKWGKVEAAAKLKFMKLGNRQFDSVHTQEALQRVPQIFTNSLATSSNNNHKNNNLKTINYDIRYVKNVLTAWDRITLAANYWQYVTSKLGTTFWNVNSPRSEVISSQQLPEFRLVRQCFSCSCCCLLSPF